MTALLVGNAQVSTGQQDLTSQRDGLAAIGVAASRIYVGSPRSTLGVAELGMIGSPSPASSPIGSAGKLTDGLCQCVRPGTHCAMSVGWRGRYRFKAAWKSV
jgi:hypothetical protein